MSKKMLIDASHAEETRVVVLDGNRLEDFDVETVGRKQIKGNIYLAKVIRVEPSLQAAFVEYGGNRHGFLAFGEIHPDYYQIPVADRQKLLDMQAEAEAEANRAEDIEDMAALADAPLAEGEAFAGEAPEIEIGVEIAAEAEADGPAAMPLEIRPIIIHEAPPPHNEAAERPVGFESAEPLAITESELDSQTVAVMQDGDEAIEPSRVETVDQEPEPEQVGGDGDDAAEARERRLRQRFLRNYKIQDVIHRRQIMLVQVVKEERGNKGAALTTYLSLAGRFSVLMPNSPTGGGVSRKITSQNDRRRLKETMAELDIPQGMGMIVRTAGANRPKPEIKRDCEYLLRLWDDIRDKTMESSAPTLIYEEANLIKRTIRDVYTRDIESILVDGAEGYKAAQTFMRMLMPANARKVQLWTEDQPLFSKYQVETQLDAMLNPVVQLRSGGYIVINQTEALVAIDVNSGRSTRERNVEDTALRTNLEAVDEVAKQLRMRDLAGLVVIDFIDMESRRNNSAVERKMKDALRHDRARIQVGAISHFGLMELSRQRLRPSLTEASLITCPHCAGMGNVRSPESAALHILRAIEDEGAKFKAAEIGIFLAPETAFYLFNHKRERLTQIETRYAMRVVFTPDATMAGSHFRLERIKAQTVQPPAATPIRPERVLESIPVEAEEAEDKQAQHTAKPENGSEGSSEGGSERNDRKRRRRRRGRRDPSNQAERAEFKQDAEATSVETASYDGPNELDLALEAALGASTQEDSAPTLIALDLAVEANSLAAETPSAETPSAETPSAETLLLETGKPKRGGRKRKSITKAETSADAEVSADLAETEALESTPEAPAPAKPKRGPRKPKASPAAKAPKQPSFAPENAPTDVYDAVPNAAPILPAVPTALPKDAPAAATADQKIVVEPAVKPILIGATESPEAKKTGWWRR